MQMFQAIIQTIEQYGKIMIYRHERPDPDALGSQSGLAAWIRKQFPDKQVGTTGENEPSLSFLTTMDEQPFEVDAETLVIVCDTANMARIDGVGWDQGAAIIKIDHHPNEDPYGEPMWVDTKKSSTCEMVTELVLYAQQSYGWTIPNDTARLCYAGLIGDTGRFQFNNTTPNTMRMAAELLAFDFDPGAIYAEMYKNPESLVRLRGEVLQNFTLTENGAAYMYLTRELLGKYNVTINESSAVINSFADTEGVIAWVFFVEEEQGSYRVRFRSRGPVINQLAVKYRGGGHTMAAGAKAENRKETEDIIQELENICRNWKQR
ncbi:phosphoesterase RecJ domain-containing protein [Marinococcus luteus]|uniref:Phosphoesterase RecJ domain-containing protein n=1 Tax=Marinococcus luteus TaxID=1122204 RepID=A0A1H2VPH8_9BACI|nr:bifunctional oligoribonuclease/PAP phosphatase NrnA [Marinococcus luteus]SDW69884.1 phosphoesterase RecJ domain-containing protein [Marinococcus luteus]